MPEVRLIDANALMEKVCGNCRLNDCVPDATDTVYGCMFADIVEKAPTIDTLVVRHGQWKYGYCAEAGMRCYFCTACGKEAYWDTDYGQQLFDFCQNCGAQMDVDVGDDNGKID